MMNCNNCATFEVRPGAKLDWSADLRTGDTIASSAWTGPQGLTLSASTHSATATVVWAEGFAIGSDYTLTNTIVTAQGRTDSRVMVIRCRECVGGMS